MANDYAGLERDNKVQLGEWNRLLEEHETSIENSGKMKSFENLNEETTMIIFKLCGIQEYGETVKMSIMDLDKLNLILTDLTLEPNSANVPAASKNTTLKWLENNHLNLLY